MIELNLNNDFIYKLRTLAKFGLLILLFNDYNKYNKNIVINKKNT